MGRENSIKYSVVIPCYNEENYVREAIKSLKQQTYKHKFEIIVVNNNSTDKTAEVAKQEKVRLVNESRAGVCFAREAGTLKAKGEIVISTDADTVFKKDWLEKIDKKFTQNDDLVAVCGSCRYIDGPWWGKIYTHFLFGYDYIYSIISGHPFYVTATNIAFKKKYFEGYDLSTMQGGDELYLLHSLRKYGKIKFLPFNPTLTSGRRLTRGLFYNIFVTFLYFYLGAYYLNKIFKKPVIGSAPAFRTTIKKTRISFSLPALVLVVLLFTTSFSPFRHFISDNFKDTKNKIVTIIKDIY